jgi:hypothetical protein
MRQQLRIIGLAREMDLVAGEGNRNVGHQMEVIDGSGPHQRREQVRPANGTCRREQGRHASGRESLEV